MGSRLERRHEGEKAIEHREPRVGGIEGQGWLVRRHRRIELGIADRHVRWVGGDDVEVAEGEAAFEVGAEEVHASLEAAGIEPRHGERRKRKIGGCHLPARPLDRHGHRHRAGAGAEVEYSGHLGPGGQRQRQDRLDEVLGFGSRNENPSIDDELAAVELALPCQVGERFAGRAPGQQFVEASHRDRVDLLVGPCEHLRLGQAECQASQPPRFTTCRRVR